MEQLRCISFVIALLVSTTSLAQKYIGISGGIVNNILAGSEVNSLKQFRNIEMSSRTGPTFSLLIKKELTPFVYLKYEAAYVRRGNICVGNPLWNLNVEYISVPLKFGFQPINSYNVSKDFQFGIEAGVGFNYAFGRALDNIADAYSAANDSKVRHFSVSGMLAGNFEYKLSPRRIVFVNTMWYSDLIPLLSYESGNATYQVKNRGLIFTAGLLFPLR